MGLWCIWCVWCVWSVWYLLLHCILFNPFRSPLQWAALLFHRALWHDVEAKLMYSPLQVRCLLVLSITPCYFWGECMVWTVWTVWCMWSDRPPILVLPFLTLQSNDEVKGTSREAISKRFMLAVRGLVVWDRSSCIANALVHFIAFGASGAFGGSGVSKVPFHSLALGSWACPRRRPARARSPPRRSG